MLFDVNRPASKKSGGGSGLIQRFSERKQPMPIGMAQKLLRALDSLVGMGDRRAAAVQLSEVFRSVRLTAVGTA